MKLLTPVTYRMKREQDAWLKQRAEQQGHGNKALTLRMLIDRAMRAAAIKELNGRKKATA